MTAELRDGERLAFDGKATQYREKTAIRGRLRITNQRLLFDPDALNISHHPLEIPLTQIIRVRRRKGFLIFNTRLAIELDSGACYAFASRQRDRIAQVLKGSRPSKAPSPSAAGTAQSAPQGE
jgi:hypothetical protein